MDKGIKLQKEIAMGTASKRERERDPKVVVRNKLCKGGAVKPAMAKRKK